MAKKERGTIKSKGRKGEIKMVTPKDQFINLLIGTGRPGIAELVKYLEANDWFTAPASSRFHCSYEGGLVDHSLAVYRELCRLMEVYKPTIELSDSSARIIALLHDLCKMNMYKPVEKSRKTDAGWEKYMGYEVKEQFVFGGHGSKSVYLASQYIQLSETEAAAINGHMGTWEEGKVNEISALYHANPVAWLLHVADEAATFVFNT